MTPVRRWLAIWALLATGIGTWAWLDSQATPRLRVQAVSFAWRGWPQALDGFVHGPARLWIHYRRSFVANAVLATGLLALGLASLGRRRHTVFQPPLEPRRCALRARWRRREGANQCLPVPRKAGFQNVGDAETF